MNLRVNLIAENERRSCSVVTPRFLIGLVGAVLAAVIVTVLGGAFIARQRHASALKTEQWNWGRVESEFKRAQALAARRAAAERIVADLEVWEKVRLSCQDELTALADAIPETLQLTELNLARTTVIPPVVIPKPAKRGARPPKPPPPPPPRLNTTLRLTGKTSSPTAEADVARLLAAFSQHPFTNTISSAAIPPGAFRQNPAPNAGPADRIFEIICTYHARTL